jgi:uncharacterized spore protein YtfJ
MREDVTQQVAGDLVEGLTAIFGEASPGTIFSAPKELGETLIVTAVAWERAGGFGFGSGTGSSGDDETGSGVGAGGGGASQGRPVAVIRIGPGGVEVKPVVDFTKVGITVFLSFLGIWRALRR